MTDFNRRRHQSSKSDRQEDLRTTGPAENPAEQGRLIEFPLTRFKPSRKHPAINRASDRRDRQTKLIDLLARLQPDSDLLDTILKMIDPNDKYRGLVELIASGDLSDITMDSIIELLQVKRLSNALAMARRSPSETSPARAEEDQSKIDSH
ncbi:MAG: hypothetical protein ACREDR_21620 [Blastocatellia bacterium]